MSDKVKKYLKGGLPPVLLIFGEEDFLVDSTVDALADYGKSVSEFDFEVLDAAETTLERITDSAKTYPFVSEKRVVIVKHFDALFAGSRSKKGDEKSPLGRYLSAPQESTSLVLVGAPESMYGLSQGKAKTEKIMKSLKFPFSKIVSDHEYIEFPKVWESEYPERVIKMLKADGYEIENDALALLLAQTNPSLRDISNELEKLRIFLKDRKKITSGDVGNTVGASRTHNVFELQKAVGARNLPLALSMVESMLSTDRQEMLIMTMLTRYFTVLWKLIEADRSPANSYKTASLVGVNSYFLAEYLSAVGNYKPQELDGAFAELADADEQLKSSSVDGLTVIQRMLIKIMDK